MALVAAPVPAVVARVVVEDWQRFAVGAAGVPEGWQRQTWGAPRYDFTVAEDGGRKVLHLRSANDRSTISRVLPDGLDLGATPVLEWSWKVSVLPPGGDARRRETTDQAAQVYVVWPRFPGPLRSRILGYAWDTTAPPGSVIRSRKTGTVTYVIVRSGPAELGRWFTERRDVVEDYRRVFGEAPDVPPRLISLSIDSNDTHSTAESFIGPIGFVPR